MTASPDLDRLLRTYLQDGPVELPDASFDAIRDRIERTRQRVVLGQWRLPDLNKIVAFGAATASVVIVAVIGVQFLSGPNVVAPPGPTPTPVPSAPHSLDPSLSSYSAVDMPRIALTSGPYLTANPALDGVVPDDQEFGRVALNLPLPPGRAGFDESAFVEGRASHLNTTDTGGYVSWVVLFETIGAGDLAYHFVVGEHQSAAGWGLDPLDSPTLGFESEYFSGPAYGWDTTTVYVWREDGLVLAAVGVGEHDPAVVEAIAFEMDARATER
jgi:hypothetical protein